MAFWSRKKQAEEVQQELAVEQQQPTSNLPEEVQEYYESGNRNRAGVAWLLGLGTLVVTVLLALALFFGGRWIYRTIAGNDDGSQETTQIGEDQKQQEQSQQNSSNNSGNQNQNQNQGQTPSQNQSPQQTPSQPNPAPSTPQPQPAPSPAPTPTPAPTTPVPTTPTTGSVPNTGPGDVAAIAGVVTAVVATAGAYTIQLRRND